MRDEYVAMLSIIGSAVCVAGAWLMRRAKIKPESTCEPSALSALVDPKYGS